MRAPGAVSGMFALECAMDELAYALKIDPLELRLINYAETDPESGKPFSSKALRECYRLGAEKFGWKNRKSEPRSMRDGRLLVGWGMATGVWGAFQMPATARITLRARRHGACRQRDQRHRSRHLHGDDHDRRRVPRATSRAGEVRTRRHEASAGTVAGRLLDDGERRLGGVRRGAGHRREAARARQPGANSPLKGATADDVEMLDGRLRLKSDPSRFVSIADVMKRNNLTEITETFESKPSQEREKYATMAHGAQFVEVKVDPRPGHRPRHARH